MDTRKTRTWAEVSLGALRHNVVEMQRALPDGCGLLGVVKADAYGHGASEIAAALRECGCRYLAVACPQEALALRQAGETMPILILGAVDAAFASDMAANDITLSVECAEKGRALSAALRGGERLRIHLKLDTGMGRYGFLPSETDKILSVYSYMDAIAVTGIYTHLHSAFCNKKQTLEQAGCFHTVLAAVTAAGYDPGLTHISNSAALLRFPELTLGAVRVGSAILGRLSFKGSYGLKRIGTCEATVEELRWLPKGHTCGYGAGWRAKKPTRIAVLPVGWYNGFGCQMGNDLSRRKDSLRGIFSNLRHLIFGRKGYTVLLGGKRCRVLGHIGMLHTVVDVTNVNCKLGDKAVFDVNPLMLKGVDVVFQ